MATKFCLNLVVLLILLSNTINAQVSVDVDYLTGSGYARIPLQTVTEKDITIPISLSARLTGVRVAESDGFYGQGWSLNAGGGISREVRSLPDDFVNGWLRGSTALTIHNFTAGSDGNTCNEGAVYNAFTGLGFDTDSEADIYTINLPTVGATFIFNKNKEVKFLSDQEAIVTPIYSVGFLASFEVIDGNGFKYILGQKSTSAQHVVHLDTINSYFKRYVEQYSDTAATSYATAWHVSKIISPHGAEMNFNYTDEGQNVYRIDIDPIDKKVLYEDNLYMVYRNGQEIQAITQFSSGTYKLLSSITGTDFTVNFIYEDREDEFGKLLDKISILRNSQKDTLTYDFTYISAAVSHVPKWLEIPDTRMFLKSLTVKSNTMAMPPFEFDYYHVTAAGSSYTVDLPPIDSERHDLWGYYNGSEDDRFQTKMYIYPGLSDEKKFRTHKLPSGDETEFIIEGNDRIMNPAAALAGTLKKIALPDGGTKFIFYEGNTYTDDVSSQVIEGGGLRVKKTITHDGVSSSNDIIMNYSYLPGYLISVPRFYMPAAINGTITSNDYNLVGQDLYEHMVVRTDRDISGSSLNYSGVMYPQVTVSKNGFGKSVYYFDIPGYYPQTSANNNEWEASKVKVARPSTGSGTICYNIGMYNLGNYAFPFFDNPNYGHRRGQINKVEHYNSANQLLTKTQYTYTAVAPAGYEIVYSLPYEVVGTHYPSGDSSIFGEMYLHSKTSILTGRSYVPDVVTTTTYDPTNLSQSIVESTDYNYGVNHSQPASISMTNSDGIVYRKKFKYVKDYPLTGTFSGAAQAIKALDDKNINLIIEEVQETQGSTTVITGASLSTYKIVSSKVLADKIYSINKELASAYFIASNFTSISPKSFTFDNDYVEVAQYYNYEAGFPESSINRSGVVSTVLYGDNYSNVVLQTSHAKSTEVLFQDASGHGFTRVIGTKGLPFIASYTGHNAFILPVDIAGGVYIQGVLHPEDGNYNLSFWYKSSLSNTIQIKIYNSTFTTLLGTLTNISLPVAANWERFTTGISLSSYLGQNIGIRIIPSKDIYMDDVTAIPAKCFYTTNSYDAWGRVLSTSDQYGRTTFYEYDLLGRVKVIRDQDKNIINYNEYGTR